MLTYELEKYPGLPLYESLYRCIREDIRRGRLSPNEKLPSKRSLAAHLEVSKVTVETAYARLVSEGYLRSVEKVGYFVEGAQSIAPQGSLNPEPEPAMHTWPVDLTAGASSPGFPFSVWMKLQRQVMLDYGDRLLAPLPSQGYIELRRAIADHLAAFRDMRVDPRNILIGAGTDFLYNLLIQLLGREKIYALEEPGYQKIRQIYAAGGVECVSAPMDAQGILPQSLGSAQVLREKIYALEEPGYQKIRQIYAAGGVECVSAPMDAQGILPQSLGSAQVLHCSPSHHFPTGIVTTAQRRGQLLQWVQAQPDRWLIEDDYDSEFRFHAHPLPALQSMDAQGRVIYMNTFSRSLAPSIRISYMVLPPRLMEQFRRTLGFYSCTVPSFEQYTLARFLSQGHFEKHINRMRKFYRSRRNLVIETLRNCPFAPVPSFEQYTLARFLSQGHFEKHINRMRKFYRSRRNLVIETLRNCPFAHRITIMEQDAGLHFLLRVDTELSDEALVDLCSRAGIRIQPLSQYYRSTPPVWAQRCLVVNYSGLAEENLLPAVAKLGALLETEGKL